MKKIQLLVLIGAAVLVSSCEKTVNEQTQEPKKFSKLTPAEHKSEIQSSAINLVNEVESFSTSQGVKASVNFTNLADEAGINELKATPVNVLYKSAAVADGKSDISELVTSFTEFEDEEEYDNILDAYNDIKGSFIYNNASGDFDWTAGSSLIVKFPSVENGTTNDAVFEVTKFETTTVNSETLEEIGNVVPTAIEAQLTIGGEVVIEYSLTASYKDDGTPEKLESSLTISGYTISGVLSNNSQTVSAEFSMKNNGNNILGFKGAVNGNLTEQALEDGTVYYHEYYNYNSDEYITTVITKAEYDAFDDYVDEGWVWDEVAIEEILHSSYAFIEIFDVRIGGEIDVKGMVPAMNAIDDDWDAAYDEYWENDQTNEEFDDEPFEERYAEAMNQYMHFFAAYIDDNKKIADMEFYVTEGEDTYTDYVCDEVWNEEWQYWDYVNCREEEVTETYTYTDGRMVFGDGSKVSAETYLEDGFSSFFDEINEMIRVWNREYDLDMEEVDYDDLDM